jgi:Uma2 family endonuclease
MPKVIGDAYTLTQFLRLPEFKPALEYIGGRIIQKMSPKLPHSVIQSELLLALNTFARPRKLGRVFPELRAVFGGSAQVPDLSFYAAHRVPKVVGDEDVTIPADIAVEILSPGQTVGELRLKLRHSLRHGSRLGWLIQPSRKRIHVLRPGQKSRILKVGDDLSGEDVLPGFLLSLEEIFGWIDQD